MAVRLEPSEHAAWSAVLAASPWRSLAHWCREVVSDALTRSLNTPSRVTELPDISADDAAHFVHLCAQLNELARGVIVLAVWSRIRWILRVLLPMLLSRCCLKSRNATRRQVRWRNAARSL